MTAGPYESAAHSSHTDGAMNAEGLFARFPVDEMYGLHTMPGLPAGEIHTRSGPLMAAEDNFEIALTGRGGHASAPHLVIDPLVVAAEIVLALQAIVARTVDPLDAVVVSCTDLVPDGARNALPDRVVIRGDARMRPGQRAGRGAPPRDRRGDRARPPGRVRGVVHVRLPPDDQRSGLRPTCEGRGRGGPRADRVDSSMPD